MKKLLDFEGPVELPRDDVFNLLNQLSNNVLDKETSLTILKDESFLYKDFIEKLAKRVKPFTNGDWEIIKLKLTKLLKQFERLNRRLDLLGISNESDFWGTLSWMAENGKQEDLELILKIKEETDDPEILKLIKVTERSILERVSISEPTISRASETTLKESKEDVELSNWYLKKPLLLKLEDLRNNLTKVQKLLGVQWIAFVQQIEDAYAAAMANNTDEVLEILSNLFKDFDVLDEFSMRTQKYIQKGGLLSASEQTPAIMNESLVQNIDISININLGQLYKVLTEIKNTIQIMNSSAY